MHYKIIADNAYHIHQRMSASSLRDLKFFKTQDVTNGSADVELGCKLFSAKTHILKNRFMSTAMDKSVKLGFNCMNERL